MSSSRCVFPKNGYGYGSLLSSAQQDLPQFPREPSQDLQDPTNLDFLACACFNSITFDGTRYIYSTTPVGLAECRWQRLLLL